MTGAAARGTSEGLTGPIDRAGRACGDGLGVLKHLELQTIFRAEGDQRAWSMSHAVIKRIPVHKPARARETRRARRPLTALQ
eukprot:5444845-Prymnesium_polylepis.1